MAATDAPISNVDLSHQIREVLGQNRGIAADAGMVVEQLGKWRGVRTNVQKVAYLLRQMETAGLVTSGTSVQSDGIRSRTVRHWRVK